MHLHAHLCYPWMNRVLELSACFQIQHHCSWVRNPLGNWLPLGCGWRVIFYRVQHGTNARITVAPGPLKELNL